MPFPKPHSDEERDEFISRCMEAEKDGIPDRDQRLAACFDSWREEHGGHAPSDKAKGAMRPNVSEDESHFIERCMASTMMQREHPDSEDRNNACQEIWEGESEDEPVHMIRRATASDTVQHMQQKVVDFLAHKSKDAGFSIKAAPGREAEILIYGEIGDEMFGGVSAKSFAAELKKAGKLDKISLRLNSPGGNVFDGMAIFNTLMANPATVEVNIDGLAASAASIVAMAGQTIYAAENAVLMIHDPWALVIGSAEQMRAMAGSLDKIAEGMAKTYARRTGKSLDEMRKWMMDETWFSAEEAIEAGLVDKIYEPMKVAAHFDIMAWRKRFRNPPEFTFDEVEEGKPISAYKDRWLQFEKLKIQGRLESVTD